MGSCTPRARTTTTAISQTRYQWVMNSIKGAICHQIFSLLGAANSRDLEDLSAAVLGLSCSDLQYTLGWFAVECNVAWMVAPPSRGGGAAPSGGV